jgi:hypothetical protein
MCLYIIGWLWKFSNRPNTHVQLFVLHCTTTWCQPTLRGGFVDDSRQFVKDRSHVRTDRYTAVCIELLPNQKITPEKNILLADTMRTISAHIRDKIQCCTFTNRRSNDFPSPPTPSPPLTWIKLVRFEIHDNLGFNLNITYEDSKLGGVKMNKFHVWKFL